MSNEDFTALLGLIRSPSESDLTQVANRAREEAARRGLVPFPALPGATELHAQADPAVIDLSAFVDMAVQVQAGLLYVHVERIGQDDLPQLESDDTAVDDPVRVDALRAFHPTAQALIGQVVTVGVGFPHGGIVHTWTQSAPWAEPLSQAIEYLEDHQHQYGRDSAARVAEISRLAELVAAMPQFKGGDFAQRQPERIDLTEIQEMLADDRRHEAMRIVRAADNLVRQRCEPIQQRLQGQLPALAAELAADPAFLVTGTVGARRQITDQFLRERAEGYTLSSTFRDELERRARDQRKTPTSEQLF